VKYIWRFTVLLKRLLFFGVSIFLILAVYEILLPDVWQDHDLLVSILALWLFTAYYVLPKIHRFLSKIYVPSYFIGRTRTADGLLSDPINLAVNGTKEELVHAMHKAGWEIAEPLKPGTVWRAIFANVLKRSYPNAPVSQAFLFGESQALAFQKQVDNNPRSRHHVRFWRTPSGWYLPGGYKVDWLGAATFDGAVGFSFFTSQFTHKIDANVDKERDFLIKSLKQAKMTEDTKHIKHFFPGYKSRNGFGHFFVTDGSMVIAQLKEKT
jgi:hypothetical protein